MNSNSAKRGPRALRLSMSLVAVAVVAAACATASNAPMDGVDATGVIGGTPMPDMPTAPPSPDPRVGLDPGFDNAGEASWNMSLLANRISPENFVGETNSDLAFSGDLVFQGNYNGYQVWDISDPSDPTLVTVNLCPASQSDVSVYGELLFVSGEGRNGRIDCGVGGVPEPVSAERIRGIRVFDISDVMNPVSVANVQTCRGSHTHTLVSDPNDDENVYVYVSGSSSVRDAEELPGCIADRSDPNSAQFRIEVIKVPLANPQDAAIVSSPRIFDNLDPNPRRNAGARPPRGGAPGEPAPPQPAGRLGPTQCHDITTYPWAGLAGGACNGYGLLLDISDVANPVRLDAASDTSFSLWHSATFSNDGTKVLFSDEWGGGSAPRCRADDYPEWGANALFTIENGRLNFQSYYKMLAPQTEFENCVAHNGSMIPIPGREVMVQAWYQGGISVFDWTDVANPTEIAFFDRGPVSLTERGNGGSWSVYWYNGLIVSSEIARGLDVLELTPSGWVSQNEIDAAKTVVMAEFNAQEQQHFVWPPTFVLNYAYLDQLQRSGGLSGANLASTRAELARIQRLPAGQRRAPLMEVASSMDSEAQRSSDAAKVRMLAASLRDLANAGM